MFRRTVRTLQSRIVPVSGRCLRHTYIYMLSLTKARRLSVFSDGALKDSASCGWMRHHGARGRIVAGRCPGTSFGRRLADGCGRSAPGRLPRRRAGRCAVVEALYERIAFRTGLFEAWRRHVSRALWGLLCGIRRAVWGCSPVAVPRRRRFALLRHVPQTGIPSFAVRSHGPPHLPIAPP